MLTDEALTAISTAININNSGELRSQCESIDTIFILYLGRVATGEESAWYMPQLMEAKAACEGVNGKVATVDIKQMVSYSRQHTKSTSTTLEKALQKNTPNVWRHYKGKTLERLGTHGLPHAAQRFMALTLHAEEQYRDNWTLEREYLATIFFDLWTGRGIMGEMCMQASMMLHASPAARVMRQEINLAPVPGQGLQMLGCQMGQMVPSQEMALGGVSHDIFQPPPINGAALLGGGMDPTQLAQVVQQLQALGMYQAPAGPAAVRPPTGPTLEEYPLETECMACKSKRHT